MREQPGFAGFSMVHWVLPVCLLTVGCGASSDGGGPGAAVLTEAPHCPAGTDALIIEGSVDGGAIEDSRGANSNAGYVNVGSPRFDTPLSDLVPLESNQLALTLTWKDGGLYDGQTGAITGGTLTLPSTHPSAGAKFCVTKGEVGFVDGGAEDAAFKFAISEVQAGADCSGAKSAVDLRGCYNH